LRTQTGCARAIPTNIQCVVIAEVVS